MQLAVAVPISRRASRGSPRAKRQEALLFVSYRRDGDLRARRELIERFLPLAHMLARRYRNRSEPLEDLMQVASLALVKAIDRYDADRGTEFSSYAVPTILGELRRHFRDLSWSVHVSRGMQERVLRLSGVVEELSSELGSSPTPWQIAAAMGIPVEEVLEVLSAAASHDTVSLDGPVHRADGDSTTIADTIGTVDEGFDLAEMRPAVARALRWLPERQRTILYLRFQEDLTQSEIARRLGMSQMHVSRLIRRSLDQLRELVGEA
ncbi:MAG TPA: SigB/SigF/SigG family RNA polymerase sigma factor [Thermoleophilaceae bacterium]